MNIRYPLYEGVYRILTNGFLYLGRRNVDNTCFLYAVRAALVSGSAAET